MAGSEAEERIRTKAEAALRREFPDARIVHEVNTSWGGARMDLAAVRPGALTLVEIKSERDVLKRLPSQAEAALRITGDVRIYAADKHAAALDLMADEHLRDDAGRWKITWSDDGRRGQFEPNPSYCRALTKCRVLIERGPNFDPLNQMHDSWWLRLAMQHAPDPRALLEMLWADELRELLVRCGIPAPARSNRTTMKLSAQENLTGRQIREGVCTALRNRPFARADEEPA